MTGVEGGARRARRAALSAARPWHLELLCLPALALVFVAVPWSHGWVASQQGIIPYYVRLSFVAHQIHLGQLPFWSPYVLSGTPILADPPTGLFYPLTMPLFLAMPVTDAINTWVFVHLVVAGLSMYLYLGTPDLHLSRPARFLGAAIYMLSGCVAADILAGFVQRLAVYALIPLSLYVVEQLLHTRAVLGTAAAGGLIVACQFLAGDPQIFVYATIVLVVYAIARAASISRSDLRRSALPLAIMFGFAGALAAIQILPTLQLYLLSNRAGFDPGFALLGSIPPIGLASLIAPHFFGDEVHGQWGEGELGASDFYVHASTLYVGFFTLALVIIALYAWRDRWHVRFFGVMGVLVLWLALGRFGYLYRAVVYIPFLRSFRDIEYINTLVPLCASVLAAVGLDRYGETTGGPDGWREVSRNLVRVIGAVVIVLAFTVVYVWRAHGIILFLHPFIGRAMLNSAVFVLVAFGISVGLLWRRSQAPARRPWLTIAVIVFVIADLVGAGLPFVTAGSDMRAWEHPDTAAQYLLRDPSLHRIAGLSERAPLFGLQDVEGETGLLLSRYSEYTNYLQGFPLNAYVRPGSVHGVIIALLVPGRIGLLNLLNLKYALRHVTGRGAAALRRQAGVTEIAPDLFVLTNPTPAPRVTDVYDYEVVRDGPAILREMVRPGHDPRRQVVLEETPSDAAPARDSGGARADLRVVAYEPNRVVIRARFARPGFLVLGDPYYPAWTAEVDGRPARIYRANYVFRAVEAPAGDHEIQFTYRDRALAAGAAVSGLGLLIGAVAWVADRRRRSGAANRERRG
ncbi:MAG: YfhO family protein [bacterium]